MKEEPEKRFCRVCDGEMEIIPEEAVDYPTVALWYCEHCNKLYRFCEVAGTYDMENNRTIYD